MGRSSLIVGVVFTLVFIALEYLCSTLQFANLNVVGIQWIGVILTMISWLPALLRSRSPVMLKIGNMATLIMAAINLVLFGLWLYWGQQCYNSLAYQCPPLPYDQFSYHVQAMFSFVFFAVEALITIALLELYRQHANKSATA